MRTNRIVVGVILLGGLTALSACPPTPASTGPARPDPSAGPRAPARPVWERLEDKNFEVRRDAVRELESNRSERALAALEARFEDEHPEVRQAAEETLDRQGAAAAPLLVRKLTSKSPAVPERAARLLARIGAAALDALKPLLTHPRVDVRSRAFELVVGTKEPNTAELLIAGLSDASESVRAVAVKGLRELRSGPALDRMLVELKLGWFGRLHAILAVIGDLKDPRVAATALEKFGSTTNTFSMHELLSMLVAADPTWTDRLAEALAHPKAQVRLGVLRALRYDAQSLGRLEGVAVMNDDGPLEAWAKTERTRIGAALRSAKAKQGVAALLKDPEPEVRYAAAELLLAAGEKVDFARAQREYVQSLQRRIKEISKPPRRPKGKAAAPAPAPSEGPDHLVILHAQLGEVFWWQSCPVPQAHGLCLAPARTAADKAKRAKAKGTASTFLARRPALVKRAKAEYENAMKTWQDGAVLAKIPASAPDRVRRIARSRHYAAWAQFQLGEIQLDALLRPAAMPALKVVKRKRAAPSVPTDKLEAWLGTKRKQLDQALASYDQAVSRVKAAIGGKERRSDFWSVAAVARKGQLYELFAKLVTAIPLPKGLPEGEGRKAVETWKVTQAQPFLGSAAKEYERCLGVSDTLLRFWEWSLVCESGLGHTDRPKLTAWRQTHPYRGIRAPRLATKP